MRAQQQTQVPPVGANRSCFGKGQADHGFRRNPPPSRCVISEVYSRNSCAPLGLRLPPLEDAAQAAISHHGWEHKPTTTWPPELSRYEPRVQRTDWKCFTASLHNHDLSAVRDPDSNLLRSSMTSSAKSHFSPSCRTPARPAYCPNAGSQSKTEPVVLLGARYRKAEPRTSPRKEICICSRAAERVSSLLDRRGRAPAALPIGAPVPLPLPARPALRPGRALAPTPAKPDSRPSRLCKDLRYQRWKSPKPFVLQKELKVFQVAMLARSKQQRKKPAPAAWEEERSPEGGRAPTALPLGDAPRRADTANSCPGRCPAPSWHSKLLPWAKQPTLQKANAARAGV